LSTISYRINPPLTDSDLNALFARSWPNYQPRKFGPILEQSLAFVGAYADERLVGFVNTATDGGAHAFLLDPTVDPDFRGRGIGVAMVGMVVDLARVAGCEWLHVDYEPELASFYSRVGFRETTAGLMRLAGPG
jgi:GNAT superfamily N-acetyltransferase